MWNKTTRASIKKILFIGAGPNDFSIQGENDAAIYQVLPELHGQGYKPYIIDSNPYSVSLESIAAETFWLPLTVENIKQVILENQIDSVMPLFGGYRGIQLWDQVLQEWSEEDGQAPQTLGLKPENLHRVNDVAALSDLLDEAGLPVIQSQVIRSQDEANEWMRENDLPLIMRAHNPAQGNTRQIVERLDEFEDVFDAVKEQSLTQEILISKAINGLKEVSFEVMRDCQGNCMQIGASEDMDPIGIHTADSLSISPVLTIQDQYMEQMRAYAIRAANLLQIEGALHVQFAISEKTGEIYIIKVSPYIDQVANRMALMTGYPVMLIAMYMALGIKIENVQLPHRFHEKTAMMEPMMDHMVVKLPVFAFGDLKAAGIKVNPQLSSVQKSVGSTLGFGRTFVEALEKAIRSAHFNNRSFSPDYMKNFSDDELIQQLIHPQENRVLLFIEALRRGYEVDELAELSHIDEFYFYQLQKLIQIEREVDQEHFNANALYKAKKAGLSDGLIAHFWESNYREVRQFGRKSAIRATYKALEPSAGEFPENAHQYYATFESEDESKPLGEDTVLVIGSGAFRIGESATGGYATTITMSELRRLQYHTIIMNNNSSDATLLPHLSDKQYMEPLEISDVMAVVDKEHPRAIIVPGNRRKLIAALKELKQNVLVLPKEKHQPLGPEPFETEYSLNFFYDGKKAYPLCIGAHRAGEMRLLPGKVAGAEELLSDIHSDGPGLYQLIWRQPNEEDWQNVELPDPERDTWLRPMPYGQIAFLSKSMKIQFIRLAVRALLNELSSTDYEQLDHAVLTPEGANKRMTTARTDYQLHLQPEGDIDTTRFELGVGISFNE
ncbi:ATP-grasp domain-containing protein [Eupransor demetentiae]|uniref:carbamoyl-phosphate synthase (ammonia) n=1 Tax=Eupransor demetentiae TaxID=3109584 RepID=A0ABP0EQN7_9LACO|nr:Carbamoylphosphate synthase large subunit (CarB) [Lactobacillaceae bacterium LMG 33000]